VIEIRMNPEQVTHRATVAQLREQAAQAASGARAKAPAQAMRVPTPRRTSPRGR